jgi:two-component system, NtrC family, nitrogen regulation sensor histidine kinase NtrY
MSQHSLALSVLAALGAATGAIAGAQWNLFGAGVGGATGAIAGVMLCVWYVVREGSSRESQGESLRLSASQAREHIVATIANNAPDAVVLFTDTGTIRYSNRVARNLFFDGHAAEGENFIRLAGAAAAPLREALLGETDRFFSVDADGQESYHLSRRHFSVDSETLTLLVVKHMTREIRRQEVEVLKRVVRVISHEVNNSLGPVISLMHSARLIASKLGQLPKYERVFDTIDERANHLKEFLHGYAALARLPLPQRRETDWGPLISQIGTLYPQLLLPTPPAKHGWIDAGQIEQVLINLIKNAYEASGPSDAVELRISTRDDGVSEIEVLDRGSGLSEEALQNALLPLYTTKPHGSGMGLALTREIIEAHGGSLELANRPGGGALMRVCLAGKAIASPLDTSRARLTLTRA